VAAAAAAAAVVPQPLKDDVGDVRGLARS